MGVQLSKQDLENIKHYKYTTNQATPIENYFYNYVWDFIANNCLPDWLAPNLLTLMGITLPLTLMVTICIVSPSFGETFLPGCFYQDSLRTSGTKRLMPQMGSKHEELTIAALQANFWTTTLTKSQSQPLWCRFVPCLS